MDTRKSSVYQIIVNCPHCDIPVQIMSNEINCAMLDTVYLKTMENKWIHIQQKIYDRYASEGLIYGCGKPFRLNVCNHNIIATVCDYI